MRNIIIVPTITINGSSKSSLTSDITEVINCLRQAIEKLAEARPHLRDYPLKTTHSEYRAARDQHFEWESKVMEVYDELCSWRNLIDESIDYSKGE